MEPLLTSDQMHAADRYAVDELGIPELILMEHAALAVADSLEKRFGKSLPETRGLILAGPGNNGADALAVARLLHERGCSNLFVVILGAGEKPLSPLATLQLGILGKLEVTTSAHLQREMVKECDWIVDGIFGVGLKKEVGDQFREAIEWINQYRNQKWVVSIDVPSGLDSDTGKVRGVAVAASETVTLGFLKRGLLTAEGADYVGEINLASIQIPRLLPFHVDTFWYTKTDLARLPIRKKASHKGDYGHVWIFGGTQEKEGASILSSLGALKAGAGLVTILGDKKSLESIRSRALPEIMTAEYSKEMIQGPSKGVMVLGPGLGLDKWEIVKSALSSSWPLVLDADALTLMAQNREESQRLCEKRKAIATVLTPHPKEAARLLNKSVEEIENDRFQSIKLIAEAFQCLVLLKGKGTLVRAPQGPTLIVSQGDSGLAKGGSGDLLSGIIAAFLNQGLTHQQAVLLAVYLHGRASELLTQRTGTSRASLPSEIASELTTALGELEL